MVKTLVVVRGLPGSGKTSFTALLSDHVYVSGDEFWTGPCSGAAVGSAPYAFDPARGDDCAAWVAGRLEGAMGSGAALVVLDRTHTQAWEFSGALALAERYGYRAVVVAVEASWQDCLARQTHGVPAEVMVRMRDRWEPLTGK